MGQHPASLPPSTHIGLRPLGLGGPHLTPGARFPRLQIVYSNRDCDMNAVVTTRALVSVAVAPAITSPSLSLSPSHRGRRVSWVMGFG